MSTIWTGDYPDDPVRMPRRPRYEDMLRACHEHDERWIVELEAHRNELIRDVWFWRVFGLAMLVALAWTVYER